MIDYKKLSDIELVLERVGRDLKEISEVCFILKSKLAEMKPLKEEEKPVMKEISKEEEKPLEEPKKVEEERIVEEVKSLEEPVEEIAPEVKEEPKVENKPVEAPKVVERPKYRQPEEKAPRKRVFGFRIKGGR